mmetsp:Transcript_11751/g.27237  ORF Transcript_11751/g.27237 Transcript_11751/m.27237 type:complete len:301 (+) Transcript_11751:1009-1911(+)
MRHGKTFVVTGVLFFEPQKDVLVRPWTAATNAATSQDGCHFFVVANDVTGVDRNSVHLDRTDVQGCLGCRVGGRRRGRLLARWLCCRCCCRCRYYYRPSHAKPPRDARIDGGLELRSPATGNRQRRRHRNRTVGRLGSGVDGRVALRHVGHGNEFPVSRLQGEYSPYHPRQPRGDPRRPGMAITRQVRGLVALLHEAEPFRRADFPETAAPAQFDHRSPAELDRFEGVLEPVFGVPVGLQYPILVELGEGADRHGIVEGVVLVGGAHPVLPDFFPRGHERVDGVGGGMNPEPRGEFRCAP